MNELHNEAASLTSVKVNNKSKLTLTYYITQLNCFKVGMKYKTDKFYILFFIILYTITLCQNQAKIFREDVKIYFLNIFLIIIFFL